MPGKILITGRAGSGKTRSVLARAADRIRQGREGECLLLLPTQGQVDHVRGLLLAEGIPAFRDLFAHTFFTFAHSLHRGLPESLLSEEGRDYLIGDLLDSGEFPAFEKVKSFAGFRRVLGEAFRELKENGVTPEDYRRLVLAPLGGERRAASRHRELGRAFAAYDRLLRERGRLDTEDLALRAARRLEAEPALLSDRRLLLVDGFHDFTPVQFRILSLLSARIPGSVFTLSFDGDRPDQPPFLVSAPTCRALLSLGFREGALKGNRRTADPTLRRLEEGLFAGEGDRAEAGDSLGILQAARREEEVESIARAILRLVREEGVPWRDIAVLFHDLSEVMDLVEGTFERFGIPVRIYQPRPMDRQPVVRFLLDLGETLRGAPDPEKVIRLLRSGYVAGLDLPEVDRLDAHLRESRPPGVMKEWRALVLDLDLPGVKGVLKVLSEARDRIGGKKDPALFSDGWRETFRLLVLPEGLREERPFGESGPRGRHECAALEVFWRVVDEAGTRPGAEEGGLSPELLLDEVREETAESVFQVRDRRREVVNVISARQARQWEVPCLFVAGVLERQFPPVPTEDLFFQDEDRRRLNEAGLRFPDRGWRQEEERFLFYTAVTRARDRLTLSYPAADDRGNPTLPSFFLREIRQIFSPESLEARTERRSAPAVVAPAKEVVALEDVDRTIFAALEARFRPSDLARGTALAGALYNRRREDAAFRHRLGVLLEERLPRLAEAGNLADLAAAEVAFSNSALTSFLQCPYLHFVEKWLRLEPLPKREMDPLDLGNVIHEVLKDFFESGGKEDPLALLERRFEDLSAAKRRTFRHRAEAWRLRRALLGFLPGEIERNRRLGRTPELLERFFGTKGSGLPALPLPVGARVEYLSGAIDRVDTLASGSAAVVVDYKYSAGGTVEQQKKDSVGEEMTHFQLALYLMALKEVLGREPAGAELVALRKKVERHGIGRREVLEKAGLSGALEEEWDLLDEEEFGAFLARARRTMAGLVERIRAGEIVTRPADPAACGPGECDAADICRYDRWLGGEGKEE